VHNVSSQTESEASPAFKWAHWQSMDGLLEKVSYQI